MKISVSYMSLKHINKFIINQLPSSTNICLSYYFKTIFREHQYTLQVYTDLINGFIKL